ncbi:MAG: hypothetical protein DFNUSKGM_002294 [Candidatus Fervidibacter sacchari]
MKVKPSAKKEGISVSTNEMLEVAVSAPPEKGKANERLIELLAKHFGVAKSKIRIVSGHTKRQKVIEINLPQDN